MPEVVRLKARSTEEMETIVTALLEEVKPGETVAVGIISVKRTPFGLVPQVCHAGGEPLRLLGATEVLKLALTGDLLAVMEKA